ncbi:MAG: MATE family efflux transporter [Clostridiales bacterium]|nr:MATE family efflux transporter [Clostridiales bacterium]
MKQETLLTEGNITTTLFKLAIPIMATSFVQMAYNMMDMIWLGRLSTEAVAAAGAAGFLTWLGSGLFTIPKIGAEVGVAQSYGRRDMKSARDYVSHSIQIVLIIGIIYSLSLMIFKRQIIGFFNLDDPEVVKMAEDYLFIIAFGIVFYFINPVFSGIYNGSGDSSTPFKINAIGLVINMILDPLMIMGIGPFPKMGIKGAALATILAQLVVTIIFIRLSIQKSELFTDIKVFRMPIGRYIKRIFTLGTPAAFQTTFFAFIGMVLARIIAKWGSTPVAVQNVGSQIESISWMTAGGFSTAISAFVGQNYGAKKWGRIRRGYRNGMIIVGTIGVLATLLLIFGAEPVFKLFIPDDAEALKIGISYMRILGLCQLFMAVEIATGGAFNGIGRTRPPAFIGILANSFRIPIALILSSTRLGLDGVWWSITITCIIRGLILPTWYVITLRKNPTEDVGMVHTREEALDSC